MNGRILFSIIIPLYNKEKTVKRTLQSILTQSYRDFEVVVVDDGSKDKSYEVVKSIADNRVKLFSKTNGGVSSARNFGLQKAQGKWTMFFDADDEMESMALENFYNAITKYTNIKIFVSNFYVVDDQMRITSYSKKKKPYLIQNPIKAIWYRDIYIRPGNTIFHAHLLELQGGYDEDLSYNEDYEFSLRILSYRKVMYLPFISMRYIKNIDGASSFVHPLIKDFISKVDTLALDSLYKKLIVFGLVKFAKKQRPQEDVVFLNRLLHSNFSSWFWNCYLYNLIKRNIRRFL